MSTSSVWVLPVSDITFSILLLWLTGLASTFLCPPLVLGDDSLEDLSDILPLLQLESPLTLDPYFLFSLSSPACC